MTVIASLFQAKTENAWNSIDLSDMLLYSEKKSHDGLPCLKNNFFCYVYRSLVQDLYTQNSYFPWVLQYVTWRSSDASFVHSVPCENSGLSPKDLEGLFKCITSTSEQVIRKIKKYVKHDKFKKNILLLNR